MEIVLLFLKANWKWIAIGIAIVSLLSCIKIVEVQRDHYKKEYQTTQLKLDTLVHTSAAKEEQLNADNAAITSKYAGTLRTANDLVTINSRLNGENIAKDKELANLKLSLDAIRLFNASKQSASEAPNSASTVGGNDGTTASVAKALEEKSQSLADLLQVVNVNDTNHLKCINTVSEWQKFWKDNEAAVEASNAGHD